ncbi:uncharacterized protein LOC143869663 [Tasmannia lanceolata]|uniref:uncharacterized protein LOC143869663 n=1 Tax=Tasmannia lanceolata TaxID=3420 RepID=UPI00406348F0
MYARLDRALVNDSWFHAHPSSFVEYRNPGISDHSPLIIHLREKLNTETKPFKFMNMWIEDSSLFPVVEQAWSIKVIGNPMFRLVQKLKEVRRLIKVWNQNIFGRIDVKAPIIKNNLDKTQSELAADPCNVILMNKEADLRRDFIRISSLEESLVRQKSRQSWLKLGDSNSKFFYTAMKSRVNSNQIFASKASDGSLVKDSREVADMFVNHFKAILNDDMSASIEPPNPIRTLNVEDANSLTREVTDDEIKDAVTKADGDKAPGPDGFNALFF